MFGLEALDRFRTWKTPTDWSKEFDESKDEEIKKASNDEVFKPWDFDDVAELKKELKSKKKNKYKPPKEVNNDENLLMIVPYETNKKKIKINSYMKQEIIPAHPASIIFNGRSGSGKSNLCVNLLTRKQFYKDYFDLVFFFSKTAKADDLPEYLNLDSKRIYTDFKPEVFQHIFETQEKIIEDKGIHKSPKILIILDDCISDKKFLNSGYLVKLFIQNRHLNISTWLMSQSFTRVPRVCRLQASSLFIFASTDSEVEILSTEFAPPNVHKKRMRELIGKATSDPYCFLFINMKSDISKRYRKCLHEFLTFD
tara:strand:- start:3170 stop:4102 length:933 start_codon:yes stop_codon:yes gene_type:complete